MTERQVDELTGAAPEVLGALALAARPLREESLSQVCDQPVPVVRDALRGLLFRRLLRRPDQAGRHQLRQALPAEAVDAELLAGVRVELHVRVAEVMAAWEEPTVGGRGRGAPRQALRPVGDADPVSRADALRRAGNAAGIFSPEQGWSCFIRP